MNTTNLESLHEDNGKLTIQKGCTATIQDFPRANKAALAAQKLISPTGDSTLYTGLQDAITAIEDAGQQNKDLDESSKRIHERKQKSAVISPQRLPPKYSMSIPSAQ